VVKRGRPAGLKTVGFYGALGTDTPDVYVFEAQSPEDVRTVIDYWKEVEFDTHPAWIWRRCSNSRG